jgi:hypothetical protein
MAFPSNGATGSNLSRERIGLDKRGVIGMCESTFGVVGHTRNQKVLGPSYGLVGQCEFVVSWASRFSADKISMSISTIRTFNWRSNFVCSSKLGLGDSLSFSIIESNWRPNNWNRSGVVGKIDYLTFLRISI